MERNEQSSPILSWKSLRDMSSSLKQICQISTSCEKVKYSMLCKLNRRISPIYAFALQMHDEALSCGKQVKNGGEMHSRVREHAG